MTLSTYLQEHLGDYTIHLPLHTPLLTWDQAGYDHYRNNGELSSDLHQHWLDLATTLEKGGYRLTIHMVVDKPEPPVSRFYTKLFAVLAPQGLTVLLISKAIHHKITNHEQLGLYHHEHFIPMDPHTSLDTGSILPLPTLAKSIARSRPIAIVLACR